MNVEAPERIWIESEGECPYFYHEEELSDVAPPVTEYVRADKLEELAAEVEALRAEVERLAVDDLIERLRAVKWEEVYDDDRRPDDPTHKCVLVDMRPDDFRALLREVVALLAEIHYIADVVLRKENRND